MRCGPPAPYVGVAATNFVDVYANNACGGNLDQVTGYFPTWSSLDASIFTAQSASITGVAPGSAQMRATASRLPWGDGGDQRQACPVANPSGQGTGTVQVPTSLSAPTLTNVMTQASGPVKDYYGQIVLSTSECGVYRYVVSDLLDQSGTKIVTSGNFTLTEMFSNYSTTVSCLTVPPTQGSTQNTSVQRPADTQFFGTRAPACPGPNDNESFDQSFSVTLNGKTYPLTTLRHISRGYFTGVPKVDVSTTTQ